jgi:hypothetical protein
MRTQKNQIFASGFSGILLIKTLLGVICLLHLSGCSDANNIVNSIAKEIVKESDPNKGLFNNSPETTTTEASREGINNSETADPEDPSYQKILSGVRASLPGYDEDKAKQLSLKVDKLIKTNPQNQILQRGSLCNEILLKDATNALMSDLKRRGVFAGNSTHLQIGVTAMPTGERGNLLWIELWKVNTPKGVISYPLVFAEDGQGGAFFFALSD